MGKASSLVEEVYLTPCTNATAVLTLLFALLDSRASDLFISLDVVRLSRLKLLPLKYTIKAMVANGQTLNAGHFVRVRATIRDLHVRLFLRVINTTLPIVLGYPFLRQFNPLIHWKHQNVQIVYNETTHIIPVVKAYGNPHTPMSVDSADGDLQAVQKAAQPIQQLPPPHRSTSWRRKLYW